MSDQTAELKARLEARLRSLRDRLSEFSETLREPEDDDFEEQAADLDDDEVLTRLAHAGRDEVRLIEAALRRIDEGTYGKCLSCGKPISPGRLKALPEADRCVDCAQGIGRR